MLNLKKEELKKQALEEVIETLENGYNGYYCDLDNEVFNTDYHVTDRKDAIEELEEYGVFNAIEEVMVYEKEQFGECYTEVSDPVKLANMLYYIIGQNVIWDISSECETFSKNWDFLADDETNEQILDEIKESDLV